MAGRMREPDGDPYSRRPGLSTSSLDDLQSIEQQQLLNEIDKLRGYGISDFVHLPQLVVCGDQSSGKSSVLEAITEIPFPRKDTLCTRFATEIVLRRSPETKVVVKIVPGSNRSESEREELARFGRTMREFKDLPSLVESASVAMGITSGSSFSKDVLSIEISGPNRPQLTIVDLPGLIHSANRSQTPADVALVSDLCNTYISNPRTIILAVVTAMNDYANQVILKRAQETDPDGIRTLGIITKPDTLPPNSESEASFVSLAKNEDIQFSLGWHVVKNRGFETRGDSFADRNRAEDAFFSKGVWKDFPRAFVGVIALRERLSRLLLDHIKHELPKVFKEIRSGLDECDGRLSGLGGGRKNFDEQKIYLLSLSQTFNLLCKSAVDGSYENSFFGEALSEDGMKKRLRSVIENRNRSFAETMRQQGHRMQVISDEEPENSRFDHPRSPTVSKPQKPPQRVSRADALDWVKAIVVRCRGRELPGSFNPLLIGELFWDQSKKWESLAQEHVNDIWEVCQEFVRLVIRELTSNEDVFKSLFAIHLDKIMELRLASAKEELRRLLVDRRNHAMTYNPDYIAEVQRARKQRRHQSLTSNVLDMLEVGEPLLPPKLDIATDALIDFISDQPTEVDTDTETCPEVLDCMLAYYRVALKMFVDNVGAQVIERRIVGDLWDIFSPLSICTMDPKTITAIASESPEAHNQRTQLQTKRERLRKGMTACRNALSRVRDSSSSSSGEQKDSEAPETPKAPKAPKSPAIPKDKARHSGVRESWGSPAGSFGSEEGSLVHEDSDDPRSEEYIEAPYVATRKW